MFPQAVLHSRPEKTRLKPIPGAAATRRPIPCGLQITVMNRPKIIPGRARSEVAGEQPHSLRAAHRPGPVTRLQLGEQLGGVMPHGVRARSRRGDVLVPRSREPFQHVPLVRPAAVEGRRRAHGSGTVKSGRNRGRAESGAAVECAGNACGERLCGMRGQGKGGLVAGDRTPQRTKPFHSGHGGIMIAVAQVRSVGSLI